VAPHSGLGIRNPVEYRKSREETEVVPGKVGARTQASQIQKSDFYGSNPTNSGKRVI